MEKDYTEIMGVFDEGDIVNDEDLVEKPEKEENDYGRQSSQ